MFTEAPVRTIPTSYQERRRRLQRLHSNQAEERTRAPYVSPMIVKSVERCLTSLVNSLPQNNLVIENLVIRGDLLEVGYRVEDSEERISETQAEDSAFSITRMEILRLDNGSVVEHWNTVYQVKTSAAA